MVNMLTSTCMREYYKYNCMQPERPKTKEPWEQQIVSSSCNTGYYTTGMPLDFCENNWKSTCARRLTENEHKKRQKVQKEKDERGENRTDRAKNNGKNGKSASLIL